MTTIERPAGAGPAVAEPGVGAGPQIGASRLRSEDPKLLTGRARYLADHDVPGLCHVAIARSTLAHALIASIDTAAAAALPGVVAVVTAADLAAAGARPFSHRLQLPAKPLSWGVLAAGRVRFVGEPYAAVVALSRAIAEDAVELIEAELEELDPVVGAAAALAPGAPLLYPEWGTNELLRLEGGSEAVEAALAGAPYRLSAQLHNHRVTGLPLEGHGVQASYDRGTGRMSVLSSSQQPHQLRTVIAEVCNLPESAVHVVSPDIGGGFGNKQHFSREECLIPLLARITGRPVRWSQDRTEALTASVHARAQTHELEAGFDETGRVLALRVRVLADLGNPVLYFSGVGPALVAVGCLSGGYAIGEVAWTLSAVATTTCPVGAYRGFGQPEAHFSTERLMDLVAARLGLDPVAVRRANLLPDSPRPWLGGGGQRIDCGPLASQLDVLLESFGYDEWRRRQATARADGRFVGIGVSTLVHGNSPNQHGTAGRFGSLETASVAMLPDGHVEVRVGTKSQGQSHETVFAQVAAETLGIDASHVAVRDGDTGALSYGQGTWGSRSAVMGGGAVIRAAMVLREKMVEIGAAVGLHVPASGPLAAGVAERLAEVAWWHQHLLPAGLDPGLSATSVYTPGHTGPQPGGGENHDETYGSHMTAVAVEVDPATGSVSVLSALLVSDCGVVINPMVVEGQHRGAFAQGLGVALLEEIRYGEDGQPQCTSLLDYTIPTTLDVPGLRIVHRPTPSSLLGGFRGMGEAAIIAAPAVLASAVEDALSPIGVEIRSTCLHAGAIRAAVRAAGWRPDPVGWARSMWPPPAAEPTPERFI
ncbi:MAG TPA: xanthine dehydrogenase family protein molybdopterin-binding subunit [Acidimicrobiales bacterium]|nr:xanthine dehydrogenase family protein molybdopterin-binding subunit [Acidimicrobiales bacterium]